MGKSRTQDYGEDQDAQSGAATQQPQCYAFSALGTGTCCPQRKLRHREVEGGATEAWPPAARSSAPGGRATKKQCQRVWSFNINLEKAFF